MNSLHGVYRTTVLKRELQKRQALEVLGEWIEGQCDKFLILMFAEAWALLVCMRWYFACSINRGGVNVTVACAKHVGNIHERNPTLAVSDGPPQLEG